MCSPATPAALVLTLTTPFSPSPITFFQAFFPAWIPPFLTPYPSVSPTWKPTPASSSQPKHCTSLLQLQTTASVRKAPPRSGVATKSDPQAQWHPLRYSALLSAFARQPLPVILAAATELLRPSSYPHPTPYTCTLNKVLEHSSSLRESRPSGKNSLTFLPPAKCNLPTSPFPSLQALRIGSQHLCPGHQPLPPPQLQYSILLISHHFLVLSSSLAPPPPPSDSFLIGLHELSLELGGRSQMSAG